MACFFIAEKEPQALVRCTQITDVQKCNNWLHFNSYVGIFKQTGHNTREVELDFELQKVEFTEWLNSSGNAF